MTTDDLEAIEAETEYYRRINAMHRISAKTLITLLQQCPHGARIGTLLTGNLAVFNKAGRQIGYIETAGEKLVRHEYGREEGGCLP